MIKLCINLYKLCRLISSSLSVTSNVIFFLSSNEQRLDLGAEALAPLTQTLPTFLPNFDSHNKKAQK